MPFLPALLAKSSREVLLHDDETPGRGTNAPGPGSAKTSDAPSTWVAEVPAVGGASPSQGSSCRTRWRCRPTLPGGAASACPQRGAVRRLARVPSRSEERYLRRHDRVLGDWRLRACCVRRAMGTLVGVGECRLAWRALARRRSPPDTTRCSRASRRLHRGMDVEHQTPAGIAPCCPRRHRLHRRDRKPSAADGAVRQQRRLLRAARARAFRWSRSIARRVLRARDADPAGREVDVGPVELRPRR